LNKRALLESKHIWASFVSFSCLICWCSAGPVWS